MNIQWEESGSKGICYMADGSMKVASVHYIWSSPNVMVIDHVEFAYSDSRQFLHQLVFHIVENARLLGSKVIPLCDPIMEIFEKTPSYADVMFLKEKARGGVQFPGNPIRTRELFG